MAGGEETAQVPAATARRHPGRVLRRWLVIVGGLFVLIGLLGFAAHFVTTTRTNYLGLIAICPYLMGVGCVVGLVCTAVARQWIGVAAVVVVAALCVSTQSRLFIASPAGGGDGGDGGGGGGGDIVVMTANLHLGTGDAPDVVAAVRRDHVDVLMLEELTESEMQRLQRAGLDAALAHHFVQPRPGAAGTGLWSRRPLINAHPVTGLLFATVTAQIRWPGVPRPVTVLGLHVAGPVPDSTAWRDDMARLPTTLRAVAGSGTTVVGGDFNATQDMSQFRDCLPDGLRDAADQAGAGFTPTWPANRSFPPVIAIDHVLTRGAVAVRADSVEIRDTDHRALITTIRLPR